MRLRRFSLSSFGVYSSGWLPRNIGGGGGNVVLTRLVRMKKICQVKPSPSPSSSPVKKCKPKSSQQQEAQKKNKQKTNPQTPILIAELIFGDWFFTNLNTLHSRWKKEQIGKRCIIWKRLLIFQFLHKLAMSRILPSKSNHNTQRTF